jgi:hypothetical protein
MVFDADFFFFINQRYNPRWVLACFFDADYL